MEVGCFACVVLQVDSSKSDVLASVAVGIASFGVTKNKGMEKKVGKMGNQRSEDESAAFF